MKTVALIALSLFTACAAAPDGSTPTSSTQQDVTSWNTVYVGTLGGPDANTTSSWDPSTMDGTDIWPAGLSVTHTQILIRKGPAAANGDPQYLAFVVWNHDTIGHIYLIPTGSTIGSDFMHTWQVAFVNRDTTLENNNIFYHGGGSDGSPTSGTGTPTPHPNVTGAYIFGGYYLGSLKTAAGTLDNTIDNFVHDKTISSLAN